MKIAGLQKVSTIDYPGEICCVIFLWGCNFRCGFCHNPDLVVRDSEGSFGEDYILGFLSRRMGKLDAVCISGGEPLISLSEDFVRRIKSMGFKVKVDTNGSFPDRLRSFVEEGLVDYVAMDIKGDKDSYQKIVGVEVDLKKVEESMKLVNDFGGEFRTTVVPGFHSEDNLVKMGKWMNRVCGGKPEKIFLQGFKVAREGMIDNFFIEKADVLEGELLRVKDKVSDLFGEVGVRV